MEPKKTPIKPKKSNVQLMFSTHDPLQELHQAERAQEDAYFRKLDQELLGALREKSAEEREPVEATPDRRVAIDACPGYGGIWLDNRAREGRVGPHEHSWLQRFFAGLIASKP
jgi:hypothetical protein